MGLRRCTTNLTSNSTPPCVTFGTTTTCPIDNNVPIMNSSTTSTPITTPPSSLSTTAQPSSSQPDLAGIFSVVFNRHHGRDLGGAVATNQQQQICHISGNSNSNNNNSSRGVNRFSLMMNPHFHHGGSHGHHHQHHHHGYNGSRWPSFSLSSSSRSFWTKYCLLCTICGSASTILAGIFLIIAVLFRYYTTSIYYFETVPTYIPAILLSICGVSTIAFSCKRNRNIILLRITACWSLVSAALSSVITITTSLIHMNRLQTLKECVYSKNPPSCTCFGHSYGLESVGVYNNDPGGLGSINSNGNGGGGNGANEPLHFVFENTIDCDVIHGALYSCLRAVFAISVVAVLLSIFLCMLLYQLIGHERKKAYWSRIRRINSDWSTDFLACLPRNLPRERSGLMPLVLTPSTSLGLGSNGSILHHQLPSSWGPPPPYEPAATTSSTSQEDINLERPTRRTTFNSAPFLLPKAYHTGSGANPHTFIAVPPLATTTIISSSPKIPSNSISPNLNTLLNSSHPFSPTIISLASPTSTATTFSNSRVITTTMVHAPSSSSSSYLAYHHQQNQNPSCSEQPLNEYDDRLQKQIKLERKVPNIVPQILLQQQTTLRESKISISSDSDNLYSIDEDLFAEPNRGKELEAKINNQIMSLLLLEEEDELRESNAKRKLELEKELPLDSNSSSILTLQNDDLPFSKFKDGTEGDEAEKAKALSNNNNSRIISSLPSSPFLNNVKKYFRERTNSLRMVGVSPKFNRRKRSLNYTELDAPASTSSRTAMIDYQNSHVNPNYSYDIQNEIDSQPPPHLEVISTTNDNHSLDENMTSSSLNPSNSNISIILGNYSPAPPKSHCPPPSSSFTTNTTWSTVKVLKSQSLPGSPARKIIRPDII